MRRPIAGGLCLALALQGCTVMSWDSSAVGTYDDGDPVVVSESEPRAIAILELGDPGTARIRARLAHERTQRQPRVERYESELDVEFAPISNEELESDVWIITWPLAVAFECIWGPLSFLISPIAAAIAGIDESLPGETTTETIEEPLEAFAVIDVESGKRLALPPGRGGDYELALARLQQAGLHADHLELLVAGDRQIRLVVDHGLRQRLLTPTLWRLRPAPPAGVTLPPLAWEPPSDRPAEAPKQVYADRADSLDEAALVARLEAARRALNPPGPTGQTETQQNDQGQTITLSVKRLANGGWKAHGPVKAVWPSGEVAWSCDYREGKRHGEYVTHRPPAQRREGLSDVSYRAIFADDAAAGPFVKWEQDGTVVAGETREGKYVGEHRVWHARGRPKELKVYAADGSGQVTSYDALGKLTSVLRFDADGRAHGLLEAWETDWASMQGDRYMLVPFHHGTIHGWVSEYATSAGFRQRDYQCDPDGKPLGRQVWWDSDGKTLAGDAIVAGDEVLELRQRRPWPQPLILHDAEGKRRYPKGYGRWRQAASPSSPGPLAGATLTWDPVRGGCLLFGGHDPNDQASAETWLWDGATWTQLELDPTPPARGYHGAAYDARRQRLVIFGGVGQDGGVLGDTWELGPEGWAQAQPAGSPPPRAIHAMVYDGAGERVLLTGGRDHDPTGARFSVVRRGTWTYDGQRWTEVVDAGVLTADAGMAIAFDRARQAVVVQGGTGLLGKGAFASAFDGERWYTTVQVQHPTAEALHRAVYDAEADQVVVLAPSSEGALGAYRVRDFMDAALWIDAARGGLPQRTEFAAAFDEARKQIVVYGGLTQRGGRLERVGGTWLLGEDSAEAREEQEAERLRRDAPGWTLGGRLDAKRGPSAGAAARDGRALVFGGTQGGMGPIVGDETWLWDGEAWRALELEPRPPARTPPLVTYDGAGQRWLVAGGAGEDDQGMTTVVRTDVWACDGRSWTRLSDRCQPPKSTYGWAHAWDDRSAAWIAFDRMTGETHRLSAPAWTWSSLGRVGGPEAQTASSMTATFVPGRGLLLVGQLGEQGLGAWIWDGARWQLEADAFPPLPGAAVQAVLLDAQRRTVWVFAGRTLFACRDGHRWEAYAAPARSDMPDAALVEGSVQWIDEAGALHFYGSRRGALGLGFVDPQYWRFDPSQAQPLSDAELEADRAARAERNERAEAYWRELFESLDDEDD